VTGNFKTGLNLENFPVDLDDIQKFSLFEKARDFELFFRGFAGFFRGNLNRNLFLNVNLRSSFLIVNLKRKKALDK
jgi:hypothetical protein